MGRRREGTTGPISSSPVSGSSTEHPSSSNVALDVDKDANSNGTVSNPLVINPDGEGEMSNPSLAKAAQKKWQGSTGANLSQTKVWV